MSKTWEPELEREREKRDREPKFEIPLMPPYDDGTSFFEVISSLSHELKWKT